MTEQVFFTRHDGGLTFFRNNQLLTVSNDNENFSKILDALQSKNYDLLESLMNPAKTIEKITQRVASGKIIVEDGSVFFNDTKNRKKIKLHGALVDRILNDLGKPGGERFANSLIKLIENIQLNKLKDISEELYEWFTSGKSPITSDGCILAFKKVRSDYKDQYSGKFDNSPGKIVRMKQDEVDTNRNTHCSRGLHFCSLNYLSCYHAGPNSRVMIVKVNPRHIFAIPTDYQFQKGRASEYYVVGEYISGSKETKEAFSDSFIDEDNFMKAAPEVKYTPSGLNPSLESRAEALGLVKDGKARIEIEDGIKTVHPIDSNMGTLMSFATKSVRAAVKEAVEKLED